MIFKELTQNHFNNNSSTRILVTTVDNYSNNFYDEIFVITQLNELGNVLNKSYSDSFLFIDIRAMCIEYIIEVVKYLQSIFFSKVFIVFSTPDIPLMMRNKVLDKSNIQSDDFGEKNKLTIVVNNISTDFKKILSNYSYDEIAVYLPFPSYFPYEREYIISTMFRDVDLNNTNVTIMYFNATNPYDIFYKLSSLGHKNCDYILACDNLISFGTASYILKNKIAYLIVSQKIEISLSYEQIKFYEISDLS